MAVDKSLKPSSVYFESPSVVSRLLADLTAPPWNIDQETAASILRLVPNNPDSPTNDLSLPEDDFRAKSLPLFTNQARPLNRRYPGVTYDDIVKTVDLIEEIDGFIRELNPRSLSLGASGKADVLIRELKRKSTFARGSGGADARTLSHPDLQILVSELQTQETPSSETASRCDTRQLRPPDLSANELRSPSHKSARASILVAVTEPDNPEVDQRLIQEHDLLLRSYATTHSSEVAVDRNGGTQEANQIHLPSQDLQPLSRRAIQPSRANIVDEAYETVMHRSKSLSRDLPSLSLRAAQAPEVKTFRGVEFDEDHRSTRQNSDLPSTPESTTSFTGAESLERAENRLTRGSCSSNRELKVDIRKFDQSLQKNNDSQLILIEAAQVAQATRLNLLETIGKLDQQKDYQHRWSNPKLPSPKDAVQASATDRLDRPVLLRGNHDRPSSVCRVVQEPDLETVDQHDTTTVYQSLQRNRSMNSRPYRAAQIFALDAVSGENKDANDKQSNGPSPRVTCGDTLRRTSIRVEAEVSLGTNALKENRKSRNRLKWWI